MASLRKNAFGSDDEDDLESLRLAALKSLKPKVNPLVSLKPIDVNHGRPQNVYKQHPSFGAAQTTRNHNRGFRNNGGRMGRNGLNTRIRGNPNLISIQVIDENESKEPALDAGVRTTSLHVEAPKLILPQDRYHKTQMIDVSKDKESLSNKFDRYKNSSDESDSDSDENHLMPAKRERKNSLEALIDDIDNILEGKTIDEKKSEFNDENIDSDNVKQEDSQKEASDTLLIEDTDPDLVEIMKKEEECLPRNEVDEMNLNRGKSRSRSRSPFLKKIYNNSTKSRSTSRSRSIKSRSKSPYIKIKSPYRSPRRSRSRSRSPIRKRYSPKSFTRLIPPLSINTDVLNSIAMAPLSPRSAAFVLENRQILARRQMSPRRSSRSPMRRSSSPKRMRRSRSRSRSPRFDPIRKCSLSPRKRSNSPKFSPKRRSTSPRNYSRRSPNFNRYKNRNSNSPVVKQSVHKRLGTKNASSPHERKTEPVMKRKRTSRSISLSLSPSPDRNYHKRPLNETTGQLNENKRIGEKIRKDCAKENKDDPILIARKKKFESPVQFGKSNGVIKLNANKCKQNKMLNKEATVEEELSDAQQDECLNEGSDIEIELNLNIDDLWSDEESDNENEGRFKSKTSNKNSVQTISIRNLTEKSIPIPKESLLTRDKGTRLDSTRLENIVPSRTYTDRERERERERDRENKIVKRSKYESRRTSSKICGHEKGLDRKDRISSKSKVRYDKSAKTLTDSADKLKENSDAVENKESVKSLQSTETQNRRVKVNSEIEHVIVDSGSQTTDEPEIIIENDDEVVPKDDESDLRAEICRRRAERLQKAGSLAGALPTRLLKSALQEVVPKRPTSKLLNSKGSTNAADRKVLIIKSVASNPVTKVESTNKVMKCKKESGKLPIHMRLGQTKTNVNEVGVEDVTEEEVDVGVSVVRGERKSKKSRPGKRKNRKVVQV